MKSALRLTPTKSLEESFADWEGSAFGFGYGTGQPHIIPALRAFLRARNKGDHAHAYDYEEIEAEFGPLVTWLLINALCRHPAIIEYGTSPRYGWLTQEGEWLRTFIEQRTDDELIALTCRDEHANVCYPRTCNCGPTGYEAGRVCFNPFWERHHNGETPNFSLKTQADEGT